MLKLSRSFYTVFGASISIWLLVGSCYARTITTSQDIEINCHDDTISHQPTKFERKVDAKTQLGITMKGIKVDNYPKLVTATLTTYDEEKLEFLPEEELKVMASVDIHVKATCGSGKEVKMNPGTTLTCNKGESLLVELYQPECPGKKGIFTLTEKKDIDDEETNIQQKTNSTEVNGFDQVLDTKFKLPSSFVTGSGSVKGKKECILQ